MICIVAFTNSCQNTPKHAALLTAKDCTLLTSRQPNNGQWLISTVNPYIINPAHSATLQIRLQKMLPDDSIRDNLLFSFEIDSAIDVDDSLETFNFVDNSSIGLKNIYGISN